MTPAVHKEIAGVLWLVVVGFGVFGVWFFYSEGEGRAGCDFNIFFFSVTARASYFPHASETPDTLTVLLKICSRNVCAHCLSFPSSVH